VTEVLALIPARGGSKSVPRKNLLPVGGRPLIVHSILQALESRLVTRTLVSTDDAEIAEVARAAGADVPFRRPDEFASDDATDLVVFEHALGWLAAHENYRPEVLLHLRPTQPAREVRVIDRAIETFLSHPEADSLRSVELAEHTPYKMYRIDAGQLRPVVELPGVREAYNLPRQRLPLVYRGNGYVDLVRARTILELHSMNGENILPFVIDESVPDLDYADQIPELERALRAPAREAAVGRTIRYPG